MAGHRRDSLTTNPSSQSTKDKRVCSDAIVIKLSPNRQNFTKKTKFRKKTTKLSKQAAKKYIKGCSVQEI